MPLLESCYPPLTNKQYLINGYHYLAPTEPSTYEPKIGDDMNILYIPRQIAPSDSHPCNTDRVSVGYSTASTQPPSYSEEKEEKEFVEGGQDLETGEIGQPTASRYLPNQIEHLSSMPWTAINIAVVGGECVGKTAFTYRFLNYPEILFPEEHDPTEADTYRKWYKFKDIMLNVLDTGGKRCLREESGVYKYDGFVLLYSVSSRSSFECTQEIRQDIVAVQRASPRIVLVGNKCDVAEAEREVSTEEGRSLARAFVCSFF
ncbi:hypothetical protein G7Y89_g8915 [Cudoniella acicularis]|uniref:Uncharacterized protein n=1 Tax=Cudoniella acicularis TaxID=354080 RepID=A0A8H4RJD7_9HELO|nr:hypothetical protein G7Y89_g8915 [Cudoniella acicularis]